MKNIGLSLLSTFFCLTAFADAPAFTTARNAPTKTCTLEAYDSCFADAERAMWAFRVIPENPRPVAVLLMHGLSDSPYIVKDIARLFAQQGFPVIAIRFSGHGTREDALHSVHHEQWLDDVHYGFEEARKLAPRVVIGGFSMGGYMSAHMAEELVQQNRAGELAGLALFSPALKVIPLADVYACTGEWWNPNSFVSDSIFPGGGEAMRYMRMSNHSLCEFSKLYLNDDLVNSAAKIHVPVMIALSQADSAIDQSMVWDYAQNYAGPKELLYFDSEENTVDQPWVTKIKVEKPLDHSWVILKPAKDILTGQINVDFDQVEAGISRLIPRILAQP